MHTLLAATYKGQVSTDVFLQDVFFSLAALALLGGVIGVALIDGGLARRKNQLDNWVVKITSALIAAVSFLFVGYAIWIWQYYQTSPKSGAFTHALRDWWLGGAFVTHFADQINPARQSSVDVYQVFLLFFVTYVAFAVVLLHGAGAERLKASAQYVLSAVGGGLVIPLILYFTWGSTSPLTNNGLHDYSGLFGLYVWAGSTALIVAWRLGPRLGTKWRPDPRTSGPRPSSMPSVGIGVMVLLVCIPFIVLGCGYMVPGAGYYGIALTHSGYGLAFINIFAGICGGSLSGAIIAYKQKKAFWALAGPIVGYISGASLFDVTKPWIMLLVALPAPFIGLGTARLIERLGIDETKVIPLTLGTGIYAALVPGIVASGTKDGGFFGITTGRYAFQHAHITFLWQLIGVLVTVGISLVSALVVCFVLERTTGLRVSEEAELMGLDRYYWNWSALDRFKDDMVDVVVDRVPPEPQVVSRGDGTGGEVVATDGRVSDDR
jgi:ammonia channel protein AmtB